MRVTWKCHKCKHKRLKFNNSGKLKEFCVAKEDFTQKVPLMEYMGLKICLHYEVREINKKSKSETVLGNDFLTRDDFNL